MQDIKSDFKQWIGEQLRHEDFSVYPLRNDASFRSYYRIKDRDFSYVAMVAPPEREKTDLFIEIANSWRTRKLPVPCVYAWEKQKGYVLLSDFGDTLLLDVLSAENVDYYYSQAIALLLRLQARAPKNLAYFDEVYIRYELSLFQEWFCEKLLGLTLNQDDLALIETVNRQLVQNCLMQPQVVIHRDYHSRNLMILNESTDLGLIDFQDAMIGPLTYDLVSVLKDCYVQWPIEKIQAWAELYYQERKNSHSDGINFASFLKWFDLTGLQRHLKVLGIFSRLKLRDNKPDYIQDLPRILNYVFEVTRRYPEFSVFHQWLEEKTQ